MGFTTGSRGAAAGVLAGRDQAFGGGSIGSFTSDALNRSEYAVSGQAGFGGAIDDSQRTHVCSTVEVEYEHGYDLGVTHVSAVDSAFGTHVGFVALDRRSVTIVPTFGGWLQLVRAHAANRLTLADATSVDHFGVATLGTGVIFNGQMSVNAALLMPFATTGQHPQFTLGFGYVFK